MSKDKDGKADVRHENGKGRSLAGELDDGAAQQSELSLLLGKISEAASFLNGAGSDATRRIEALEQSLVDAEPGVAVWSSQLLSEPATYRRDDASPSEPAVRVVTLGFARVKKDKWGICVREELQVREGVTVWEELTLLRKSERALRIAALPRLEQLVRDVLATLEQQVSALEEMKARAASAVEPAAGWSPEARASEPAPAAPAA